MTPFVKFINFSYYITGTVSCESFIQLQRWITTSMVFLRFHSKKPHEFITCNHMTLWIQLHLTTDPRIHEVYYFLPPQFVFEWGRKIIRSSRMSLSSLILASLCSEQSTSGLLNRPHPALLLRFLCLLYNVTATAHVKIFEAKIRSNLTWHSNMLQTKDLSKKSRSEIRKSPPRETTRREDVEKQSLEHGEVLIFGLWRLHYIGNGNQCSRCSPEDPAASCAVTSASAGKPWSIHSY